MASMIVTYTPRTKTRRYVDVLFRLAALGQIEVKAETRVARARHQGENNIISMYACEGIIRKIDHQPKETLS